jgi:transcriptional regulator GlxA family with amidase domain
VNRLLKDRPQVDVLLVPSAYNMDPLLENQSLLDYIRSTARSADWLASNCSGAFVLAAAGILDGKKATTWAGGEADLQKAYPLVKVVYDSNYVIDGKVITSNGSVVSYEAALALLEQLASKDRAEEVKAALQMQRIQVKH